MKKIFNSIFILFSLCTLFSSCREGVVEPIRLLELYVVDTLGVPVDNAKVEFYFTELALNTNTSQIIETLYTNEEGLIQVALDIDIFDYYVNIEKEEINNWYTETFVNLPNLRTENRTTITLNNPFEVKLTGRYKKRWQQTEDLINGNPSLPSCSNQLYHDFVRRTQTAKDSRDGEVQKFQTDICPFPGTSEGTNQWIYDEQNHTITFGINDFAETYRITEFTGNTMTLTYTTPDGAFTKEKRYKLVN
ncbi:hypothetical protein Fleli_3994 [Bernardetia litoralis DSM 6794]|uniref:Lipoprotein n=1 Tax=Bernardetia litoralis (strain ATCC 23117 / DSM 6794 / NBRC 15988 / NCIMB 1366 / Fx l1 / Sio-4) TaxID=880071 RepID=I4AQR1_BERLS|nr:hypothetical protein [Bernardetia litoralis]AFM06296.1 hypothetical protein Fleli_3994 [Bernardetia litoralis DSM 6794]